MDQRCGSSIERLLCKHEVELKLDPVPATSARYTYMMEGIACSGYTESCMELSMKSLVLLMHDNSKIKKEVELRKSSYCLLYISSGSLSHRVSSLSPAVFLLIPAATR
jgi:hypothetical protein